MAASPAVAPMRNRRYRRADTPEKFVIAWQSANSRESSCAVGLNQGGVFLNTAQAQPVGTTLKMKIPNVGGDIPVTGVVRTSNEQGMGVEFVAVGSKDKAKLDLLIKRIVMAAQIAEKARKTEESTEPPQQRIEQKASPAPQVVSDAAFSEMAAKKRRYIRINLPKGLKVAWTHGQERELTIAGTVGLGGLFVLTNRPPKVGSIIRLLFDIPGGEILATATIRSQVPGRGMGVEFTEIRPEDRTRLDQLLKRLLG